MLLVLHGLRSIGCQAESKMSQQFDETHGHFHFTKAHANADARSLSKRYVGASGTLLNGLLCEAFWEKLLRFRIVSRIVMYGIDRYDQLRPSGKIIFWVSGHFIVRISTPQMLCGHGVHAQCLYKEIIYVCKFFDIFSTLPDMT